METAKLVTLYTSNSQMLRIESIEVGKSQQGYPRRNRESWSTPEMFRKCRWGKEYYSWVWTNVVRIGWMKSGILLWNALDTNIFLFLLSIFLDFILLFFWISFSFINDEEACDIAVTWCDVICLEHGRRIWKMISGHMEYIWWPWVRREADMR